MAQIADSEIERLKNEVSVQRLVESSGIVLQKTGKEEEQGQFEEQQNQWGQVRLISYLPFRSPPTSPSMASVSA